MPLLSFVIPCYRSEKTIGMVVSEIIKIVGQRAEYDYEIVCVNDCSPDNVYEVLKELAMDNNRIKVLNFAKNMGKHAAVLAGFAASNGDYIVSLDDDYQCPVGELWNLLRPVECEGFDMATASYEKKQESLFKRIGSDINNKMSELMIKQPKGLRLENFFVIKKYVVDEVVKYPNPYPYIGGLILRITNNIKSVTMEERERGDSNTTGFTLKKSISLFMNGFTAFSVFPLRIASIVGAFVSVAGFFSIMVVIINKIINIDTPLGYSSLMSVILFSTGIIMMLLGMIGEYIGRIYICINKSPQYVVKDRINFVKK